MPSREPGSLLQQWPGLALGLLVLALNACGGEGSGITFPPTTGTLQVTTTTSGDEADPDGYTLQFDAEAPEQIGTAGSIQRTEVAPGDHTLFLDGEAANCTIGGENPRTVHIVAGETLTSEFVVTCGATTGGVVVNTVTSGPAPDADGYSISLDGVDQGPLPATGQATLGGLAPGSHVVGLGGVAGNCQLQGDNLRPITVTAGASVTVDYAITCAAPPADAGTLQVTTVTTGANPDPDGYSFAVDGGTRQPIESNAVSSIPNLPAGVHTVRLSGIAGNCRIQGTNPRSVTVDAGATADLTFSVSCSRASGSIRVSVSTTGAEPDPNGYRAKLDNVDPGLLLAPDGSVRFTDVSVGAHTITLSDVAANCTVDQGASRTVSVTDGATSEASFRVVCASTRAASTTTITSDQPDFSIPGEIVRVEFSVTGQTGTPTGDVIVTVSGGSESCIGTVASGFCDITLQGLGSRTLTATYAGDAAFSGSSDREVHQVNASRPNSPPVAAFDPPTCTTGEPCQFTDASTDSDGEIVAWVWSFGDGTTSETQNPQHTYTVAGQYDVELAVSDDRRTTRRVIHTVSVRDPDNVPPTAAFTAPSCTANVACQFTDASTDTDGEVVAWVWSFGDGTTSEDQNPQHTYTAAGEYDVELAVSDNRRTTRRVTHPVTVAGSSGAPSGGALTGAAR